MRYLRILSFMCIASFLLSGCNIVQRVNINTSNNTATQQQLIYLTDEEYNSLSEEGSDMKFNGETLKQSDFKQTTLNGEKCWVKRGKKEKISSEELNSGVLLDDKKFVVYSNNAFSGVSDEEKEQYEYLVNTMEEGLEIDYIFDKDVIDTNGELLDTNKVKQTDLGDMFYVIFDESVNDADSITSSSKFTKNGLIKLETDGVISNVKLGKTALTVTSQYRVKLPEEGKCTIKVRLTNGYSKKFNFVYDKTKPVIKVKGKKLVIFDDFSGLTGVSIKSSTGVEQHESYNATTKEVVKLTSGTYKVNVVDKCGNILNTSVVIE